MENPIVYNVLTGKFQQYDDFFKEDTILKCTECTKEINIDTLNSCSGMCLECRTKDYNDYCKYNNIN